MRLLLLFITVFLVAACSQHPSAENVVIGRIWTGNPEQPWADAMAVNGDTIAAIGSRDDIAPWIGDSTQVIRVPDGQLITPGFIDSHTHFVEGGFRLSSVQLRDALTKEEFVKRIADYAKTVPAGTWIMGGDWDNQNWGGELPEKTWIDDVTPNHPVWINRLDGHMSLANSAALKAAGISDQVKDVPGGAIERKKGKPTGIFKDNAMTLIDRAVPPASPEQEDRALDAAMNYVAARGVTSAHNMSGYWSAFERARAQNRMITRIYAGASIDRWRELDAKIKKEGRGDAWLRFGNLKQFVDGSLGSHTAAFFKPFADAPNDSGFFLTPPDELYRGIKSADSAGLHLMVHAIGDKGIRTLLDIFERVQKENGPRDRRFRVEHLQHIHPADIPRLKELGVIASMQPVHCPATVDVGDVWPQRPGTERWRDSFAWQSLRAAGARQAFGSDWPVAPMDPFLGFWYGLARQPWQEGDPVQRLRLEELIDGYTRDAAYAEFQEHEKGMVRPGMLADLALLNADLFATPEGEIAQVKPVLTMVDGRAVFREI